MNEEDLFLGEGEKPYGIRHRAYHFAKDLVLWIKVQKYDKVCFSMFDQALRAGTSIGGNLVEGRAGVSKKIGEIFTGLP